MKKIIEITKEQHYPFDISEFEKLLKRTDAIKYDLNIDLEDFYDSWEDVFSSKEEIIEHKEEIQKLLDDYYKEMREECLQENVEIFLHNCKDYNDNRYKYEEIIKMINEYRDKNWYE